MKVCFTPLAVSDVSQIYDHIAKTSKTSAQRVEDAIRKACRSLGDFPEIGSLTNRKDVRRLPLVTYPYTIFYRVVRLDESVQILRILHSARIKNLSRVPKG